jgi:drug/metabolite transporter (DMT)-like permease
MRWGLDDEGLPPLTFAGLRYGLAAIVLVAWVASRRDLRPKPHQLDRGFIGRIVLLGVVFYALTQGAQLVAISEQPAATTSLVLSLTPLFVAAGAAISLAEVPTRWQVAGSVLVAVGAWLYFAGDLGATTAGMLAAIVALGANVLGSLLGRGVNRTERLPAVTVTAASMSIGAGILVVVAVALEGIPTITPRAWLLIGFLAVVNTALAFTLWNMALRRLSALESAGINNTMLIQIAALAWIFLGEAPGVVAVSGIALVSVGVFLTQLGRRTRG